jgi:AmiR/NasT family two-component response regulator
VQQTGDVTNDDRRGRWHEAMSILVEGQGWTEGEAFAWLQREAIGRRAKISIVADEVASNSSSA